MKDSLGGDGATVLVQTNNAMVGRGSALEVNVVVEGGNKPATVDALILRVLEARRHWVDEAGTVIQESDAPEPSQRGSLRPEWTQTILEEQTVQVGQEVSPGDSAYLPVVVEIPAQCGPTGDGCKVTINAQADIKHQIDPSGNGRIVVS
ncbi:MAG: sporulation protein [Nannocystaceae bacterium]